MPEPGATTAEQGFLTVDGLRLHYAWTRPVAAAARAAPAIVLLHEGLGCVAMWKSFPAALAAATGLDVFAYSRAGYGRSSAIELPRPVDFHALEATRVLPALREAAGLEDVVLVGHSDGASIALIHAGHAASSDIRGIVALAPHVLTEQKSVDTIRAAVDAYEYGDLRARLARYHDGNVDCAFRGWSGAWLDPRFADWDLSPYLEQIEAPVLALRGADDPYNSAVHLARIEALVRAPVAVHNLAGCGHAPHAEQPDLVLARICRFIESLS